MWTEMFNSLAEYGPIAMIAGVLVFIIHRTINNFQKTLSEDRNNYMEIIKGQTSTQNDHIEHMQEAITKQSIIIAEQGARFSSGIDRLCNTLGTQTEVLKAHITNAKDK